MNLYALVLALIVVALLAVSVSQVRKTRTKADYLVAGRTLPWYVLVFTLLSSWIGSGSLFAGAENAFHNGFAALWQPAGGWCGLLIIFAFTAITSYQFIGGGDILHIVFPGLDVAAREIFGIAKGDEHRLGMVIIAVFVVTFTALAGMASVAYMAVVIGSLATFAALLSVPFLLVRVGGWSGFHAALPPQYFQTFGNFTGAGGGFVRAMELLVPTMFLLIGNQSIYQKFFSARTERDARLSVVGWLGGTVLLELLIVGIAVLGAALFLHTPGVEAREIIPYTARNGVPSLVGAILVGAIFAKVISTANNYLFSPATNLVNDLYIRFVNRTAPDRTVLRVSRVLIAVLGLFALLQGTVSKSILAMSLYAYTVYSAAITPVVLAAFFWRRATAAGAVVCILAGTAITIFWNLQQLALQHGKGTLLPPEWLARDAIFPALLVSVVSLVVVSLLTRAPAPEKWAPFAAAGS